MSHVLQLLEGYETLLILSMDSFFLQTFPFSSNLRKQNIQGVLACSPVSRVSNSWTSWLRLSCTALQSSTSHAMGFSGQRGVWKRPTTAAGITPSFSILLFFSNPTNFQLMKEFLMICLTSHAFHLFKKKRTLGVMCPGPSGVRIKSTASRPFSLPITMFPANHTFKKTGEPGSDVLLGRKIKSSTWCASWFSVSRGFSKVQRPSRHVVGVFGSDVKSTTAFGWIEVFFLQCLPLVRTHWNENWRILCLCCLVSNPQTANRRSEWPFLSCATYLKTCGQHEMFSELEKGV